MIHKPDSAYNSAVLAKDGKNAGVDESIPLQLHTAELSADNPTPTSQSNATWKNFALPSVAVAIVLTVIATR